MHSSPRPARLAEPDVSTVASHPDRKLLLACERLAAADVRQRACNTKKTRDLTDEAVGTICNEWNAAAESIVKQRARTPEGLQAKALALRTVLFATPMFHRAPLIKEPMNIEDHLALALANDTIAVLQTGA